MEHLLDLPEDIKLCSKLLNNNGILQVAIPCEGEAAFTIGWKLTTGIHFKIKYGLDYSKLMEHEHVNSLEEIMVYQNNVKKECVEIYNFCDQIATIVLPFRHSKVHIILFSNIRTFLKIFRDGREIFM